MAVLDATQLVAIRKKIASELATVDFDKPIINSALQAIEDWFETNRASLLSAIDTATSPYTFSNGTKKKLVRYWLLQKSDREA